MQAEVGIGCVVTVADTDVAVRLGVKHMFVKAEDWPDQNLLQYFDRLTDFIHTHRQETNVFVHCMAGVSRSSSTVIAYLMRF
jgi:atypical dual specificity phosphatase